MSIPKSNRLVFEKSPYLLQHAYNPVDWYPWSPEAFSKAESEDKPVFLSIGYSSCHWCHVMEKESFEDADVAELLNDAFVCVKVDREERPDLDSVYMKVCQQLNGSGGWPLHIIMTPQKEPFFAATYLPKETMFGQVGMKELIPKIKKLWTSRRNALLDSAAKIAEFLSETETRQSRPSDEELGVSTLDEAYFQLSGSFDGQNGGFGGAPKFPSAHNMTFLLRYWKRTSDRRALEIVEKTLKTMRMGGVYDQLGFGFHRYSTDAEWLVPHYEKVLCDQAMLIMAYTEAYQATGDELFKQVASEIITYVLRDMTDPAGGFYSAEDADSEGEEGKFYLWTKEEITQTLPAAEAEFLTKIFSVEEDGNFVDAVAGERNGKNILHLKKLPNQFGIDEQTSPLDVRQRLEDVRRRLFEVRQKRVHPGKDDKILVDWNGLMIAALSKAAQVFGDVEYARAARRAADFILDKMLGRTQNRLFHRYRCGEAKVEGLLNDYACFAWGLLELCETVFDERYLQHAVDLTDNMLKRFWDERQGGFYLTACEMEVPLARTKEIYDGALPSGNSVACLVLIRIAHMTGKAFYEQKAAQLMRSFSSAVLRTPSACTQLLSALDFVIGPSCEVVIVSGSDEIGTKRMLEALRSRFSPRKVVIQSLSLSRLRREPYSYGLTERLTSSEAKATVYVCCNRVCSQPTTYPNKMLNLMDPKPQ